MYYKEQDNQNKKCTCKRSNVYNLFQCRIYFIRIYFKLKKKSLSSKFFFISAYATFCNIAYVKEREREKDLYSKIHMKNSRE